MGKYTQYPLDRLDGRMVWLISLGTVERKQISVPVKNSLVAWPVYWLRYPAPAEVKEYSLIERNWVEIVDLLLLILFNDTIICRRYVAWNERGLLSINDD